MVEWLSSFSNFSWKWQPVLAWLVIAIIFSEFWQKLYVYNYSVHYLNLRSQFNKTLFDSTHTFQTWSRMDHLIIIFWLIGQNYQKWLHTGGLRPYKHKNKLFHFRPAWAYEKARNTLTQTRNLQEKKFLYRRTLLLTYLKVLVIFLFTVSSFLRDLE